MQTSFPKSDQSCGTCAEISIVLVLCYLLTTVQERIMHNGCFLYSSNDKLRPLQCFMVRQQQMPGPKTDCAMHFHGVFHPSPSVKVLRISLNTLKCPFEDVVGRFFHLTGQANFAPISALSDQSQSPDILRLLSTRIPRVKSCRELKQCMYES